MRNVMHTQLFLECRCSQLEIKLDQLQDTLETVLKSIHAISVPPSFPVASSTVVDNNDLESILSSFCSELPPSSVTPGMSTDPSPSLFACPTLSPPFLCPTMPLNPSRIRACSAPPTLDPYVDPRQYLVQESPVIMMTSGGSHPGGDLQHHLVQAWCLTQVPLLILHSLLPVVVAILVVFSNNLQQA